MQLTYAQLILSYTRRVWYGPNIFPLLLYPLPPGWRGCSPRGRLDGTRWVAGTAALSMDLN